MLKTIENVQALLPSSSAGRLQTHALHLSAEGEILPHIDNVEASGPHILGISLGATRIMRMEDKQAGAEVGFDVLLPSGTVYVQRFVFQTWISHKLFETNT